MADDRRPKKRSVVSPPGDPLRDYDSDETDSMATQAGNDVVSGGDVTMTGLAVDHSEHSQGTATQGFSYSSNTSTSFTTAQYILSIPCHPEGCSGYRDSWGMQEDDETMKQWADAVEIECFKNLPRLNGRRSSEMSEKLIESTKYSGNARHSNYIGIKEAKSVKFNVPEQPVQTISITNSQSAEMAVRRSCPLKNDRAAIDVNGNLMGVNTAVESCSNLEVHCDCGSCCACLIFKQAMLSPTASELDVQPSGSGGEDSDVRPLTADDFDIESGQFFDLQSGCIQFFFSEGAMGYSKPRQLKSRASTRTLSDAKTDESCLEDSDYYADQSEAGESSATEMHSGTHRRRMRKSFRKEAPVAGDTSATGDNDSESDVRMHLPKAPKSRSSKLPAGSSSWEDGNTNTTATPGEDSDIADAFSDLNHERTARESRQRMPSFRSVSVDAGKMGDQRGGDRYRALSHSPRCVRGTKTLSLTNHYSTVMPIWETTELLQEKRAALAPSAAEDVAAALGTLTVVNNAAAIAGNASTSKTAAAAAAAAAPSTANPAAAIPKTASSKTTAFATTTTALATSAKPAAAKTSTTTTELSTFVATTTASAAATTTACMTNTSTASVTSTAPSSATSTTSTTATGAAKMTQKDGRCNDVGMTSM